MNQPPDLSLESGDLRAVFWPHAGMLGVSLRYRGNEFLRRIDGLDSARQKGSTAGIPLLYPWANRLTAPRYVAAGKDVVLDTRSQLLHFDDHGLPMHGVPWGQLHWEIVEAKANSFLARLSWDSPPLLAVFPFPHRVEMAGALTADSLTLATTVAADAGSPVPISFGFHPYFGIPHLPRAQWHLQLPAMRSLNLDSNGIPMGSDQAFAAFDAMLGDTNFDNGFALLEDQSTFSLSGAAYRIAVSFLEGYRYTQIFAPKGKDFIAIEPMTAPTNALASGTGLRVLQPRSTFRAVFRIALQSTA
jgi:aldose 1-epimerase